MLGMQHRLSCDIVGSVVRRSGGNVETLMVAVSTSGSSLNAYLQIATHGIEGRSQAKSGN